MIRDCTAIILAGGDSQRMATDKASMMIGNRTMLQHVIDTMQQLFPHVIVSVRQRRPEIDLPQVCDEHGLSGANSGPLVGMITALERVTTPWAFVVACDMPFISKIVIEFLSTLRDDNQAIVPKVQGYPQTLAAFYAKTCTHKMREHIEQGGKKSVRAMLEKLQVHYVDEEEIVKIDPSLQSFKDLDTPQDVKFVENSKRPA